MCFIMHCGETLKFESELFKILDNLEIILDFIILLRYLYSCLVQTNASGKTWLLVSTIWFMRTMGFSTSSLTNEQYCAV